MTWMDCLMVDQHNLMMLTDPSISVQMPKPSLDPMSWNRVAQHLRRAAGGLMVLF